MLLSVINLCMPRHFYCQIGNPYRWPVMTVIALVWSTLLLSIIPPQLSAQALPERTQLQQTLAVDSPQELMAALGAARGGETILLAGGSYGSLKLTPYIAIDVNFPDTVTLVSADPSAPAVFSGLGLNQVSNLTIQSVVFDYSFTEGDTPNTRNFVVDKSRNITIRDSLFEGDIARHMSAVDDGRGMATGLSTTESENVTLFGNEFRRFNRAVFVERGRDVQIVANEMHSQRSEGINIAASNGILIEGNHIHSFERSFKSGDHPDMIQFWTTGTAQPSRNIVIRGNLLNAAGKGWTQTIFIRNEMVDNGRAGREMYYQNILIEDNVIFNAHLHGITVGETDGLIIRNNTLMHDPLSDGLVENPTLWRPRFNISPASDNVEISGNITFGMTGPESRPDWRVSDTIVVQDVQPARSDWVGLVVAEADAGTGGRPEAFEYVSGGPADGLRIGSALLRSDSRDAAGRIDVAQGTEARPAQPFVRIETQRDTAAARTHVFRAVLTQSDPDTVTYQWGVDGTTQEGEALQHRFTAPGYYPVTLAVLTIPDRRIMTETTIWIEIPEEHFLTFDAGRNAIVAWQTDGVKQVENLEIARNGEIPIGPNMRHRLPAGLFTPMAGADRMRLSLRFRTDPRVAVPGGEILHLMNVLSVTLTTSGAVNAHVRMNEGAVELVTQPLRLNEGAWHDLELVLNPADDTASLFVDGMLRSRERTNGRILTGLATPMATLGHPGDGRTFSGALARFDLHAGSRE